MSWTSFLYLFLEYTQTGWENISAYEIKKNVSSLCLPYNQNNQSNWFIFYVLACTEYFDCMLIKLNHSNCTTLTLNWMFNTELTDFILSEVHRFHTTAVSFEHSQAFVTIDIPQSDCLITWGSGLGWQSTYLLEMIKNLSLL